MTKVDSVAPPLTGHWLIVSDLDGTLLDHYTYSHAVADALLKKLNDRKIPVILSSSKTFEELLELRQSLNNEHPFIVENGSAIFIPKGYFTDMPQGATQLESFWAIEIGAPRITILSFLQRDAESHTAHYLSFSNASVQEIVQATGLTPESAQKARHRNYSEPLLWQGSDQEKQAFIKRATAAGFTTLQGGRFLHVLGRTDKGSAALVLLDEYCRQHRRRYRLLAVGDSANDLDMLNLADMAVIIRSPAHKPPTLTRHPRVIVSEQTGPVGWVEVVGKLFP